MTKPSEHFRDTIREYLEQRAGADALFAASCAKEHKNLDDCITFILNYVQQSGCNGFTDAEIYSLAVHYYQNQNVIQSRTQIALIINKFDGQLSNTTLDNISIGQGFSTTF